MFDSLRKKISDAISSIVKSEEKGEPIPEAAQEATQDMHGEAVESTVEESIDLDKDLSDAEDKTVGQNVETEVTKIKPETAVYREEKKDEEKIAESRKNEKIRLSLSTKLKGAFSKQISLNQSDIDNFTDELMLTMLQSDVSYSTTEKFISSLKNSLADTKFESRNIRTGISECMKTELEKILEKGKPKEQLLQIVKAKLSEGMKPVTIMFLGPNGTGKTTTMAKIAHMFKNNGLSSVFSASDTFRAAAIEQTSFHASKIGIPVVKGNYGADPASVAFDAVEFAKAHSIDVVLVDTAGRQETNKNLLNEIKKMERVAKPDITIYVGESTAGNRIAEQIAEFIKYVKVDGIILTKLDCDAKGGNAISISDVTGLPIFFFGTGESYDALVPFDPSFVIGALVSN
ncbi:MAG: signal recognition particle-docking protein FtsY [Candidatus Marsarchaeota archaeon]|jgi:fused signal recognition particle receptor|nr:signal recognition particle-docking protein FtsY [Candidatus Marsarchaeota archaeon]